MGTTANILGIKVFTLPKIPGITANPKIIKRAKKSVAILIIPVLAILIILIINALLIINVLFINTIDLKGFILVEHSRKTTKTFLRIIKRSGIPLFDIKQQNLDPA